MTIEPQIVADARAFASRSHASIGQVRKYTARPYIEHPIAVADIVRSVPHTPEMLCAAYLHDVVEDTLVSVEEIEARFGNEIASLVGWLTDVSKPTDGNRTERKRIDREHSAAAPAEAQTIKVADLIDNTKTIVEYDPGFAVTYMREKRLLLDVLTKADPALLAIAEGQVRAYEQARLDEALR